MLLYAANIDHPGSWKNLPLRRPQNCKFFPTTRYLKCSTDILDSCCKRPHAVTGIVFAWLHNLEATLVGTSLIYSLAYELAVAQSSLFCCSISKALARTFFCVLLKLSNAKILAYSRGKDSWSSSDTKVSWTVDVQNRVNYYYRITGILLWDPM